MKFIRLAFAVLLSVLLVGAALSNAQTNALADTPTPSLFLVIVGNSIFGNSKGQISAYPLVAGVPQNMSSPYQYSISGVPGALSVSTTSHHLLYIASSVLGAHGNIGGILGYQYNGENGFTLTKLPGSPFHPAGYTYGYGLAGDYADDFLYASNYGNNNISGFQVASNGSLGQQLPGSPFAAGKNPTLFAFDAQDDFLYSANNGSISGYLLNTSTGTLTALPGSPYSSGSFPGGIVADSAHHLLYVSSDDDMTIWVYSIMSSGALVPASGSPYPTGEMLGSVALSPSGNLLYVSSFGSNNLLGYSVNTATGALTLLPGFPVALGQSPSGLTFDPTGRFLYALNNQSGTLNAFQVSPSGMLTALPGSPYLIINQYPVLVATVTLP
jgi:DNA-binding beta-propeller fold protein YncE